jgi:hypothetical protein
MQFGQLQTVGQALRTEALKLMSQLDTTTASTGDSASSSTNGGSNGSTNGKQDVRSVWHIDPAQLRYVHAH